MSSSDKYLKVAQNGLVKSRSRATRFRMGWGGPHDLGGPHQVPPPPLSPSLSASLLLPLSLFDYNLAGQWLRFGEVTTSSYNTRVPRWRI